MSGYSATPLARKLGVKAGHRLVLRHAPAGWSVPDVTASEVGLGEADVVVAFYRRLADLAGEVSTLAGEVRPDAALWIAWPRKAAGHISDLTENALRDLLLPTGLVDVKVAALDDDWSGLKFVWRKEKRAR